MKTVKDYYEIALHIWRFEIIDALIISKSDHYVAAMMAAYAAEMILEGRFQ